MTESTKIALKDEIAGVDFGAGALKVYSRWGGIELPSHVALGRRQRQARVSDRRCRSSLPTAVSISGSAPTTGADRSRI